MTYITYRQDICTVNACSKNDVILSVRKNYYAIGLGLELAEIHFRSNVVSSKCRRSCT